MHTPVLLKEVIECLNPQPNENFVDCTFGWGGHAIEIAKRIGPKGKLLGIEQDREEIKNSKDSIKDPDLKRRINVVCGNFSDLKEIVQREKFNSASGILIDLGISSWHLEGSGRGFSFMRNEPLDMRLDSENKLTAGKIVNYFSGADIEEILREFGEEKFARDIAEAIIQERKLKPIETTFQLVAVLRKALPARYQHQKLHFATKTFQALRIAVNGELGNLAIVLPQALEILKKNGRLAVISFHSLEDRIVKNFFRDQKKAGLVNLINKKPIQASFKEIKINPRSRSAKMRAIEKI